MNGKQNLLHHTIRMSAITMTDVFRLLEAASTRHAYLITALACTGARPAEIAALRWSDVYRGRRVIRLDGSAKRARLVPMPGFLAQALDRYRACQEELGGNAATTASYVFTNRDGGPVEAQTLAMRFRLHAMRTLGRPLALHEMRRWALGRRIG